MADIRKIFQEIKENDLIDDRMEYCINDLQLAYGLKMGEAANLYQMIQKEFILPYALEFKEGDLIIIKSSGDIARINKISHANRFYDYEIIIDDNPDSPRLLKQDAIRAYDAEIEAQAIIGMNAFDYFNHRLGYFPDDESLAQLPIDSNCGLDCKAAIDAALKLHGQASYAFGSDSEECAQIIALANRIIECYWRG